MAMAWPTRIKDRGGIRHQFHHAIDIVPTILEAAGLPEPVMVNGIAQKPIEGVSMAYTWADANAPGRRMTQYFEMFGSRAIYTRRLDRVGAAAGCSLELQRQADRGRDERLQVGAVQPRRGLDAVE
jgi:arylsulfatase A-like enzyme